MCQIEKTLDCPFRILCYHGFAETALGMDVSLLPYSLLTRVSFLGMNSKIDKCVGLVSGQGWEFFSGIN